MLPWIKFNYESNIDIYYLHIDVWRYITILHNVYSLFIVCLQLYFVYSDVQYDGTRKQITWYSILDTVCHTESQNTVNHNKFRIFVDSLRIQH